MTPKEKAQFILDKHRTYIRTADKYCQLNIDDEIYLSKKSSLITINEIIDNVLDNQFNHNFWEKVKTELEKL